MYSMENVRLRFAPSPTGPLHIGGARSALFNYLLAKKHGGTFLVRMEDTDLERSSAASEENIKESLKWLGLDWDEGIDVGGDYGPYRQMERTHIYNAAVRRLLEEGKAYHCFCSEEELEKEREEQTARGETPKYSGKCRHLTQDERDKRLARGEKSVIRFHVPAHGEVVIEDLVRGRVVFETDGIGDFIIVKSDGIPVYNFAVVLDDAEMNITHVIRGEEHLSNTPRQVLLYKALGYEMPKFAHISLILGKDRSKMSKRHGSTSVVAYRQEGYLPEALVNFLALLGWSPEGEEEILDREQLIADFSLERVSKSPAVFDLEKLKWLNGMYIRKAEPERLCAYALPFLQKTGYVGEHPSEEEKAWAAMVTEALKNHITSFAQLPELIAQYRADITYSDAVQAELKEMGEIPATVIKTFIKKLEDMEEVTSESYKKMLKEIKKETGIGGKNLYHSVRIAKTGCTEGVDMDKVAVIMGRELMLDRCRGFLAFMENLGA